MDLLMEARTNPIILTIDDEENIRTSFKMFLEDYDYQVFEAKNGLEGLEVFSREKPDLVICDLRMPEVDGLEVIRKITKTSPDIPIIVVSGTGVVGDAIEAIHAGAWNYLLKPVTDMNVLLHAINQSMERSRLIIENRSYQEHLEQEVTKRTQALQRAVTDLNQTNAKLKSSEQKYRVIFDNLQDVYMEIGLNGNIIEISPSISSISKYSRNDIINLNIDNIFPNTWGRDNFFELLKEDNIISDFELQLQDKDKSMIPCSLNASYQSGIEQVNDKICVTIRDVTDRKKAEARIERLAFYDALTNLPNRRLLLDRLEQEIFRARRTGNFGAMLFLDLDRFKNINDSLGHPIGDALLQEVAKRLLQELRAEDTVSRLGGDEFVVLLSELDKNPTAAASLAQQNAERISNKLAEKYIIDGHELHITPSIGVAMFPSDISNTETGDDILRFADTAMYRAKDDGRDTIRFFLPSMQSAADTRLAVEKELRYALERNELFLHFQPQVNGKGEVLGAETLARWIHPEKGFISPATFIPIAEATGLILPIGEWVLRTACKHLKEWEDQGLTINHLAVNVSPRQFRQPNFVNQVIEILEETGANPAHLGLELTEGIVIDNIFDTIKKMKALKALGIELSIDDFGTGYSSLTYLKKMPLDILKIDQSFVRDVEKDSNDAAIVETIIAMANHLDLKVIAEGVETEAELSFLEEKGCPVYQGYFFSKPLQLDQFINILKSGTTA